MLGFAPISAVPISGFNSSVLVNIPSPISATATITFGGSASSGLFVRISATAGFTFGGSSTWTTLNALSATATVTFSGSPHLSIAGRPIVVSAVPESFEVSADRVLFQVSSVGPDLTARGVPE